MLARGPWRPLLLLALAASVAPDCRAAADPEPKGGGDRLERAVSLAREILIVDTHIDVPYRMIREPADISQRTEGGDFDYPRAREGGLDAAFLSVYVPASYQESGGAELFADQLIFMVERFASRWPEKFVLVRSSAEVRKGFGQGQIALALGMENGAPIGEELTRLEYFHTRGIRYITLTHSQNNQICDSSFADEPRWGGLSPFGRQVVAEMNRLGIMIDVSHITDKAFDQVIELSRAPVIASHSSCRRFTPDWQRNMSDDSIRRLATNGGVIQINFGSAFLTEAANRQSTAAWNAFAQFLEGRGLLGRDHLADGFLGDYWEQHPRVYADISDVVAHIRHVADLAGVDHVGLGSDFDGVGDSLPTGLKDVSDYPNLIAELLAAGFSESDVRKICGENLMRVWSEVERVAGEHRAAASGPAAR